MFEILFMLFVSFFLPAFHSVLIFFLSPSATPERLARRAVLALSLFPPAFSALRRRQNVRPGGRFLFFFCFRPLFQPCNAVKTPGQAGGSCSFSVSARFFSPSAPPKRLARRAVLALSLFPPAFSALQHRQNAWPGGRFLYFFLCRPPAQKQSQ